MNKRGSSFVRQKKPCMMFSTAAETAVVGQGKLLFAFTVLLSKEIAVSACAVWNLCKGLERGESE